MRLWLLFLIALLSVLPVSALTQQINITIGAGAITLTQGNHSVTYSNNVSNTSVHVFSSNFDCITEISYDKFEVDYNRIISGTNSTPNIKCYSGNVTCPAIPDCPETNFTSLEEWLASDSEEKSLLLNNITTTLSKEQESFLQDININYVIMGALILAAALLFRDKWVPLLKRKQPPQQEEKQVKKEVVTKEKTKKEPPTEEQIING